MRRTRRRIKKTNVQLTERELEVLESILDEVYTEYEDDQMFRRCGVLDDEFHSAKRKISSALSLISLEQP